MRTVGKILLVLVLLSMVMPFVKTACDLTMLSSLQPYQAPMCHMGSLAQSLTYLDQLQQFKDAVVERINSTMVALLLVMSFSIIIAITLAFAIRQVLHRLAQSGVVHMKFWDALRRAYITGAARRIDYA